MPIYSRLVRVDGEAEIKWPLPLVLIKWEDATGDSAWSDLDEVTDYRDAKSWSVIEVGMLVERKPGPSGYIIVAGSVVPGSHALRPRMGQTRKIPSQWVRLTTIGWVESSGEITMAKSARRSSPAKTVGKGTNTKSPNKKLSKVAQRREDQAQGRGRGGNR